MQLLPHVFWIVGLALLLAAFSYHYDLAQRQERPLSAQLYSRSFVVSAWISLALVGIGAAGTSQRIWEAALWIVLTLLAAWRAFSTWRSPASALEDEERG